MTADDAAAPIRLDADTRAAIRAMHAKATPGKWKLWGMTVMADQTGSSNVDDAVEVAHTVYRDEHGKPRTFDADLICTMQRNLPVLLDGLDAAEADRDAALVKVAAVKSIRDRMTTAEAEVERLRVGILALVKKAEAGEGVVIYPGHSVFYNVDTGLLRAVLGDQETP